MDENGIILELSHAYAQFLGVTRDEVLGKPVTEVIENTRLPEVIKSRKPEIAQPHKINGTNMIASRTSLYEKMEKHNIRFD